MFSILKLRLQQLGINSLNIIAVFVQGVQAQTVANFLLAFEAGLSVVPVINKVWIEEFSGVDCHTRYV